MACTGCTPAQAWADWDLPSINTQLKYWRRHPPVHLLVAAYLEYKAPAAASGHQADARTTAAADALIGATPELPEHLRPKVPSPYAKKAPHVRN